MVKLTSYLGDIVPDPVRYWVKVGKDAGAVNNFTIGVPDPIPEESLKVYARALYDQEMKGVTGYPPFVGEEHLKKNIIEMEANFGAKLTEEDTKNMYVTIGASQALQFILSCFGFGSELLVNSPCWGTIFNMASHSGVKGAPVAFFEDDKFIVENAEEAITDKTQAVYINYPTNPTGALVSEGELKKLCGWAVANDLQIISDEPYKYVIYNRKKTPYSSPVNFGDDINENVNLVASFSKIVKPDIRLGFIRVSKEVMQAHEMVGFYFRNLSAGASRGIQAGVSALIESDPKLGFLKSVVEGYKVKNEIVSKYMLEWGCKLPYKPVGTYMMFPTTPDDSDAEDFVRKTAAERKTAFIPGSSFGGSFKGFEHIRKHFRIGFGGGMTKEKIDEVMQELVK